MAIIQYYYTLPHKIAPLFGRKNIFSLSPLRFSAHPKKVWFLFCFQRTQWFIYTVLGQLKTIVLLTSISEYVSDCVCVCVCVRAHFFPSVFCFIFIFRWDGIIYSNEIFSCCCCSCFPRTTLYELLGLCIVSGCMTTVRLPSLLSPHPHTSCWYLMCNVVWSWKRVFVFVPVAF